ncbi:MAG: hypothetical protein U0Q16_26540 [Bryobacteraceae bacterium]
MESRFGCDRCWPADAAAAWEARRGLSTVAELVDESHLHVMLLRCDACGQRFLSVFTEIVDWADGEDSQYWKLLPLTAAEAEALQRESLNLARLEAVGSDRRCLRRDWPKGEEARAWWGSGLVIGPHA